MIRIHRPESIPAILKNRGQKETARLCAQFDTNTEEYTNGTLKFSSFKGDIYGSKSVRKLLMKCQNNKCCYCEAKFVQDSVHVEHFRPKGAIGEKGTKNKRYPGYYWLAYEWTNLLLCKAAVNSDKKDYFPLEDESTRTKNHREDKSLECPMLIDPASEDPRKHIRFHNEEPYGITNRGRYTVNLLLRHPDLDEARRERYKMLMGLKDALVIYEHTGNFQQIANIKKILEGAVKSDAEYSSMAIDLLR